MKKRVAQALELFGVSSRTNVTKDDEYTFSFTIHAKGPLYASQRRECHVRVDMSRGEKPLLPHNPITLNEAKYGIPPVELQGMSLEEVLAEKIRAILRRSAARDVYDIWFLIERLGVRVDVDAVKAKLSFYGSTLLPSQIIEKVETRAEHWEAELRPLIFGELPTFNQVVQALKKSLGVSRDV